MGVTSSKYWNREKETTFYKYFFCGWSRISGMEWLGEILQLNVAVSKLVFSLLKQM